MNNGQTKPGYNVQIATENQFITNYGIYWRPTDWGTMKPFLDSFRERYGSQSDEVVADSGYGNEANYAYMEDNGIDAYVKYNMFHAETKRRYAGNAFLVRNMYYNAKEDYYVCPMGQHMERCGTRHPVSDLGYRSEVAVYRAVNCKGCPFRGMCYKGRGQPQGRQVQETGKGTAHRRTRDDAPQQPSHRTGGRLRGHQVQSRLQAFPTEINQESEG